jgi:hypothetical protein
MKKLIFILGLLALTGFTEKANEQLSIHLGVYEDGMPFWGWEGNLHTEIYAGGKVTFPTGSNIRANFQKNKIRITAIAKLSENDLYTVKGEYTSTEPFTFLLLGAGESGAIQLELNQGSGEIDYSGTLKTTFTKPSANQSR